MAGVRSESGGATGPARPHRERIDARSPAREASIGRAKVQHRLRTRALACLLAGLTLLASSPASAFLFRLGEVEGILDVSLGYGTLLRLEERNKALIGIANGGTAPSVNFDDGDLNYARGLVSNMIRGTGELTLSWLQFGAVVRGVGFYDFESELVDRVRTPLSDGALGLVGHDAELREYFATARFVPFGIPIQLRAGKQTLSWGETGFLRLGVDVINPVDLVTALQPATTARDLLVPQGMVWGVASLTDTTAIEAFYQYDWQPVRLPPVGWFFSADDLIGGSGTNFAVMGDGQFADQGTDLDAAFGLPSGTLGFDANFMKIPGAGVERPNEQGQFGVTVQTFLPDLNDAKVALHFINYHSRLPLVSGRTANEAAVGRTTQAAVDARAAKFVAEGLSPEEAEQAAQTLTIGEFTQATRYVATYPRNIKMIGASFNTALIRTGTLVNGEVSHHIGWPVQIPSPLVLNASLSPIRFTDQFGETILGSFGANETVQGFERVGKTQVALGLLQLLGPQLGAVQSFAGVDLGWIHMHDLPEIPPLTADSFGYRVTAGLTYESVFGAIGLRPQMSWVQDVVGNTPPPLPAFLEGRKGFVLGLGAEYTQTWTAQLAYSRFMGAGGRNRFLDRDFLRFNVIYNY